VVLDKIKRYGLYPRAGYRKSIHPERVYFAFDPDQAKKLIPKMKISDKFAKLIDSNYALLRINTVNLSHIKLYNDPNLSDKAYYGLINIPPRDIEVLETNL
jgi:hypothetical protein